MKHVYLVYAMLPDGAQTVLVACSNRESAERHIERITRAPDEHTMSAMEVLGITGLRIGTLAVDDM